MTNSTVFVYSHHPFPNRFCSDTFWNASTTWYTTDPDLSQCFQKTVLIWIPCAVLWLMLPFQYYRFFHGSYRAKQWSWLVLTKIVLSCALAVLSLAEFSFYVNIWRTAGLSGISTVDLVAPLLEVSSYVLSAWFIYVDRHRGSCSSGILLIFWILMVLTGIVSLRTGIRAQLKNDILDLFPFIVASVAFPLLVAQLILSCIADRFPILSGHDTKWSKELSTSVAGRMIFSWFDSIAYLGWKRPLTQTDLWDLVPQDTVQTCSSRLERNWKKELAKVSRAKTKGKRYSPSLTFALFKSLFWTLLQAVFYQLLHDCLLFAAPQILRLLIGFVRDPTEDAWKGYLYAGLLLITGMGQSLGISHLFLTISRDGMRIRSALTAMIYRKALRISSAAKRSSNVGEMVNLMSVDAQRLCDFMLYINLLYSAPFRIGLAVYFLWQVLGIAVLAGLGVLVLTLPLNVYITRRNKIVQIAQLKHKDRRVNMVTEVLNGIKALKLYAWEESFENRILNIREQELRQLQKAARLEAASAFNWFISPFFVAWCTFATYVYMAPENVFTAEKAFVAISLLNCLRLPLTLLPRTITVLVQSNVSVKRITSFLMKNELNPDNVRKLPTGSPGPAVMLSKATLSWGVNEPTSLHNVNLQITDGQLVAIIGQVGSGKSSMVAAMLGLMEKLSGEVGVKGTVAYVPQQAWIQNLTLKENILFGSEFNRKRYDRVIEACALLPDLEMLDAGDETEIGEKGANLSGGQRQRVSLARAVYADADVYFLDDPLSAVDGHVGKHIFERVIGQNGLLKGKTRVLVTHGINYLPQTDLVVVLSQGAISEIGAYDELVANNAAFAEFLRTYLLEETAGESVPGPDTAGLKEPILSDTNHFHQRTESPLSNRSNHSTGKDPDIFWQGSNLSGQSVEMAKLLPKSGQIAGKLVEDEVAMVGKVKWNIYNSYFKNASYPAVIGMIICYILSNALNVGGSFWLTDWVSDAEDPSLRYSRERKDYRLGIYGMFGGLQALFILLAYLFLAYGQIVASRNLHRKLLTGILRAPMWFFDTTPLGRIVNRFSKDMEVVDSIIPNKSESVLYCFTSVGFTLLVISITNWIFIPVILPLAVVYYLVQRFYIPSALQLSRLDATTRSPIYSHFQESVQGSHVIVAARQGDRFIASNERHVNTNLKPAFLYIGSSRWVAIRLDFAGNFICFFTALVGVISRNAGWGMSAEQIGLSISYALSVTHVLDWMVQNVCAMESNIVSVERIKEYSEVPSEADLIIPNSRPARNWPASGQIQFNDYKTRYRPGLELVLKGINCRIESGEKIGVVGRTGAGKSSLTLALFRLIEAVEGSIVIDDVNIANLGLQDVRSRITILPQEPVLFSGTLRMNLDPFERYSDEEVWRALEDSHLKGYVSGSSDRLELRVAEGGENLSVGQRQLICLARALLRKTRVLVLDEATAAIDLETDALIQETIRRSFADCTVLTVAHRISTIMDSSRIMVLDRGQVVEFDSPERLLSDVNSLFFQLAKSANLV